MANFFGITQIADVTKLGKSTGHLEGSMDDLSSLVSFLSHIHVCQQKEEDGAVTVFFSLGKRDKSRLVSNVNIRLLHLQQRSCIR